MKSNTKTEIVFPKRIVLSEGKFTNIEGLLTEKPLQIGLAETNLCTVEGKGFIVLDYGKEICGTCRILTSTQSDNTKIRIRFGESVAEACAEPGEKGCCNDHSTRDTEAYLRNWSDMRFCQTGFRFIRIDFLEIGAVNIKSIIAEGEIFEAPLLYDYEGNDARIKEIFNVAKRTVSLCASSGYIWDGIKRDRLVWIGDMYPETMSFTTLYGRQPITERSLNYIKDQTPLPGWMNGMSTYSLWWIIICADYAKEAGADDFMKDQLDYMKKLIDQSNSMVSEDGALLYPDLFVDWPTHEQVDEPAGVRAINIIAAKRAIDVFEKYGVDKTAAEELLKKLLKVPMEVKEAKQVIGLKYFAVGELTKAEADKLIEGGARGMSTFMSYFILTAIRDYHGVEKANEIMKEYYGAMIDRGATTFFEDFDMDWLEGSSRIDELPKPGEKDLHGDFGKYCYIGFRHSFCHGWSAGVIMYIKENC